MWAKKKYNIYISILWVSLSPPWQVPFMSDKMFSKSLTCSRKTLAQCLSDPYLESDSQRVGKKPRFFHGDKRVGMNEHDVEDV